MTARYRIQTRRSITLPRGAYDAIKRAAAARGAPMSTIIDQALGDLVGADVEASVARAAVAVRPKAGRQRKAILQRDLKPDKVSQPVIEAAKHKPRHIAIAPPRSFRRYMSPERRMLGDHLADAWGFR